MISSVAGKNGNPMTPAYAASKHAIEGLSESLRREMMLFGIDVIMVAPGAVKTPIWGKAERGRRFRQQAIRPICRRWKRSGNSPGISAKSGCRRKRWPS